MSFPEEEYKALDILKENPHSTQREVASKLGFSLGKTHYVLRALIDKGLIKVTNFTKSDKGPEIRDDQVFTRIQNYGST